MTDPVPPAKSEEPISSEGISRFIIILLASILVFIGIFFTLLFRSFSKPSGHVDVLFDLPAFSLTDQTGATVTRDSLAGKFLVVNFIFTRCPGVCPLLTKKMGDLGKEISAWKESGQIRFLSFTADPEYDTPPVLSEYAAKYSADPERWKFLTGDSSEVEKTIVQGFKISMGKEPVSPSPGSGEKEIFEIVHGERFVLVDSKSRIRGYYSEDGEGQKKLKEDLRKLLEEHP
ncbi:MAG: SCO family protein [Bdellovibrionota bacterium]